MPRFRVVQGESTVRIEARSSLHPVVVVARELSGHLDVEVDGDRLRPVAAGRLEIPVRHLRSGNALLDRETERRLDVRRHPTIVAELERLEPAGGGGRHRAHGRITCHGVTHPAEGEVRVDVTDAGRCLRVRGAETFDARDFDLRPPRLLLLRLEPEVRVRIDVYWRVAAAAATDPPAGAA